MKVQGQVKNREAFLKHITERLGRHERLENVTVPEWELKPQYKILNDASQDELVELFKAAAKKVNTSVLETSIEIIQETVKEAIESLGETSIITWDDQRFKDYKLTDILIDYEHHTWSPSLGNENIKIAERAGIGITFSDYTLAESATVILTTAPGKGRSVSLLPNAFIALIPKSTIVPRLTQVTDSIHENYQENDQISSCIKFISGPSNSADIELNLVVGVHGPVKAIYIIIDDC
ncbi:lactate utilization protein C [Anaerobacillus sp. MEB173]|uniref:LutC/YkgG family protein n=1 Tax=Anaerobacillus sp. MEB173 TaxID=3383345 RepID=UPI003F8EF769